MTGPRLGLDRDLRRAWLDAAAAVASSRLSSGETQAALMRELDGQIRGSTPQSGRGKTVTILRRIWFTVPSDIESLRDRAITLLAEGDADDRLALHWAMLLATHPFFADAAAVVGRLVGLQGTFERAHLMRRLTERWGDRSTLARAVPRLLASLTEWGRADAYRRAVPACGAAACGAGAARGPATRSCSHRIAEPHRVHPVAGLVANAVSIWDQRGA